MNKKEIGSFGERQAVRMLQEKGFRILDTNWSCAVGDVATPISIQSNDYAYPLKSLIPRGLADKSNCSRFKTVSYPIPKSKKTE